MRRLIVILLLFLPWPAAAQEPEWRIARDYDVLMMPFDYAPRPIRLIAGQPVRLRFINQGRATFSFSAPRFFRAARVRRGDADLVRDGHLRLRPGEQRTITLVPAAGRYRAASGNRIHRLAGMRVRIIVEPTS